MEYYTADPWQFMLFKQGTVWHSVPCLYKGENLTLEAFRAKGKTAIIKACKDFADRVVYVPGSGWRQ